MSDRRLNLATIETTLRRLQSDFRRINPLLDAPRDNLEDEVLENMLAGYAYIDQAIATGFDFLAPGHLKHLIELNALVLCGEDPRKRSQYATHREATEKLFYDHNRGGIRDVLEWYEIHQDESIWRRTAGVYIRMLSRPQLFIEGNHRTGALVISYLLARAGRPPFVLDVDNVKAYFHPSSLIKKSRKDSLILCYRMHKLKNNFAKFLQANTHQRHLLPVGSHEHRNGE
jgi:hypothetical protein